MQEYLEYQWKEIKDLYRNIYVHVIPMSGIGEVVPRLVKILREISPEVKDELHMVKFRYYHEYPGGICNRKLLDLFGRYYQFIDEANDELWEYILKYHRDQIVMKYYRREKGYFKIEQGVPCVPFSPEEVQEAETKMQEMNLNKEYVCLHVRKIMRNNLEHVSAQYQMRMQNHNVDLESMRKTCEYLQNRDMQIVRLGRFERERCTIPEVIDYANLWYDELMDFYLLSKCKFTIGTDSGLSMIAPFWGRPILMTNVLSMARPWNGAVDTGMDMYIPKKYWSEKKQRYLNLWEILDLQGIYYDNEQEYEKIGIILESNSEDEILEAAIEMNEKLDGTWEISDDEIRCMDKYQKIISEWRSKVILPHDKFIIKQDMCRYKICYSFLKRNPFFLDVVDYKEEYLMESSIEETEQKTAFVRRCEMMSQWVRLHQEGKHLSIFLAQRGFYKIAIYGMDYIGETLLKELQNSEINVLYGIDRNAANIFSDIRVAMPDNELDVVDAIIVTAIAYYAEIRDSLKQKIECPIISLEDILYTMTVDLD